MEEGDVENDVKRTTDRSRSPGVKSSAVVKYSSVQCPVGYARLQCNTDLNLPPSNWGTAIDYYGLKQILTRGTGLSSFRMAHMFPDSVGEVDVISGAECIKKLLKLPYQPKGTVSMIVHRVHNTLLLDDFDIYDYLMKSEWAWLKDFFYENIMKTMSEQEKMLLSIDNAPSAALQLTSKFLLHSVASLEEPDGCKEHVPAATLPACYTGPFLPEPETKPELPTEHLYNRNVLWTFENIHMLIGSDLPIFGGGERPCVSLRLRDAREPINVLTGIDYWLDNLMCNVPEVLMCYHLDGIVQKYEPMSTEDLPNMENSKFSPKVVRNVAQNILSFLKSNATKAGHTYWLFKGPHDDVVKLYDLTSLCPDVMDNPFTTPVAMLLYRVARNMRLTNRTRHVRDLLTKALSLLSAQKHPQIYASAQYMLADLFVPAATDPATPRFEEESSSESDGEDDHGFPDDDQKSEGQLALRDIGNRVRDTPEQKSKGDCEAKALGSDPPSRCGKALRHALEGLQALRHVTIDKCKEEERQRLKQQIISEEQHPKMANPFEPITMQYEPLKQQKSKIEPKEHNSRNRRRKRDRKNSEKNEIRNEIIDTIVDKNAIQILKESKGFPCLTEPSRDDNYAWKLHLKTLLYEKICLCYATLAEYSYANEQYGFSLKYIDIASKCQKLLSNLIIKSRVVDASCLLGRLGDNYFQLSKYWSCLDKFRKQFETDHDIDSKIRIEIETDLLEEVERLESEEYDLDISWPCSEVEAMVTSCALYQRALRVVETTELLRRYASVSNELALRYMHDAHNIFVKYVEETDNTETAKGKLLLKQFNNLSKKSWEGLSEATDIFRRVNDLPNLALLYCNQGRYMRFKAHCEKGPYNTEQRATMKSLYSRAAELYNLALSICGQEEGASTKQCGAQGGVGGLAAWELSCLYYTRATCMLDEPDNYPAEPNEVADALKLALKHCHLSPGPRQYLYQFRAAMIYHRLGSLYHAQYRVTNEEGPRRRTMFASARSNYEHAANMFASIEDANMFLTATMERVALYEAQAQFSPNLKLKSLQTALQLLRQCQSIMTLIHQRDGDDAKETKPDENDEKTTKNELELLCLYENRLNFILKSVIQYCRTKSNKDYEKLTDIYKKFYQASLKIKKDENDVRYYAKSICDVLSAMDVIERDVSK